MIFRYAADVMRYRKRDIARQAIAIAFVSLTVSAAASATTRVPFIVLFIPMLIVWVWWLSRRSRRNRAEALNTTLVLEDDALSVRIADTTVWRLSREHIRRITHDRNGVVTLYHEEVGQVFRIRLPSLERGELFWQQLQTWRQADLVPHGAFDAPDSIGMMVGGAGGTVAVLGVFHEMPRSAVLVGLLAISLLLFLSRTAWRWRHERTAARWVLWTAVFLALLVVARVIQVTTT